MAMSWDSSGTFIQPMMGFFNNSITADSTTESALGKLFYLLGLFEDNMLVKSMMELNLRGEISK